MISIWCFKSPDGKYIACGAIDGIINIFDMTTGKLLHTLEGKIGINFVSRLYDYLFGFQTLKEMFADPTVSSFTEILSFQVTPCPSEVYVSRLILSCWLPLQMTAT